MSGCTSDMTGYRGHWARRAEKSDLSVRGTKSPPDTLVGRCTKSSTQRKKEGNVVAPLEPSSRTRALVHTRPVSRAYLDVLAIILCLAEVGPRTYNS